MLTKLESEITFLLSESVSLPIRMFKANFESKDQKNVIDTVSTHCMDKTTITSFPVFQKQLL